MSTRKSQDRSRKHLTATHELYLGNTSYNFMLGKVVAIYAVVAAHFSPTTGNWIAASVGLFVFGFYLGVFYLCEIPG